MVARDDGPYKRVHGSGRGRSPDCLCRLSHTVLGSCQDGREAAVRPRLVIHKAGSVNGRLSGWDIDLDLHYRLAGRLGCDATLVGSGTILASPEGQAVDDPAEAVRSPQPRSGPLLVIADSRGRVKCWSALQSAGLWKRFVSLASSTTPAGHLKYLRRRGVHVIIAGDDRIDFAEALERLSEAEGVLAVRVDSGGTLNGGPVARQSCR
jgi:2,5-diamino-6-(ribosylamino)-4(3H)-pyrimidinone 5'-phosphate reductase